MPTPITEMIQKAGLPEDFATKAEVVFAAALTEQVDLKVAEQTKVLQESFDKKLEEAKAEFIEEQAQSFDEIVQAAIVEWLEKNSTQVDASLKAEVLGEMTEGFKAVLKNLNIEIPEDQKSLVESAQAEAKSTKETVAELQASLQEAQARLDAYERADIVVELTEGLSELASDRVAKLALALKESDIEKFRAGVAVLVEAFGGKVTDNKIKDGDDKEAEKQGEVEKKEVKGVTEDKDPGVDNVDPAACNKVSESTETNELVAQTLKFLTGKA